MLMVSFPASDLPSLDSDGRMTTINCRRVKLIRSDGYLCYEDGDGKLNWCKIIDEFTEDGMARFACCCHGDEHLPHQVTRPDGRVIRHRGDGGEPDPSEGVMIGVVIVK